MGFFPADKKVWAADVKCALLSLCKYLVSIWLVHLFSPVLICISSLRDWEGKVG